MSTNHISSSDSLLPSPIGHTWSWNLMPDFLTIKGKMGTSATCSMSMESSGVSMTIPYQNHVISSPCKSKTNYPLPTQCLLATAAKHVHLSVVHCVEYVHWALEMLRCPIRHLHQQNHPLTLQMDYKQLYVCPEAACQPQASPPHAILCRQPVPTCEDCPFLSAHSWARPHHLLPKHQGISKLNLFD